MNFFEWQIGKSCKYLDNKYKNHIIKNIKIKYILIDFIFRLKNEVKMKLPKRNFYK